MAKGGQTQTVDIPDWARPYYAQLYNQGSSALAEVPEGPYQGARVPDFNTYLQQAMQQFAGMGNSMSGLGNQAIQLGQDTIGGKYLTPDSNPYLQAYTDAAIRPIEETLVNQLLPQIGSGAQQAGAYGGSRQGVLEGQTVQGAQKAAGDISTNIYTNAYNQERQNQLNAASLINQGVALNAMAPGFLGQAGGMLQGQQRAEIGGAMQQHQDEINAPFQGLNQFKNLISGINPGSVTTSTGNGTGLGGQIGSGVLGLVSMLLPLLGPGGMAAGAGLGAASGMLGNSGVFSTNPGGAFGGGGGGYDAFGDSFSLPYVSPLK
jgi:hypothetical protein